MARARDEVARIRSRPWAYLRPGLVFTALVPTIATTYARFMVTRQTALVARLRDPGSLPQDVELLRRMRRSLRRFSPNRDHLRVVSDLLARLAQINPSSGVSTLTTVLNGSLSAGGDLPPAIGGVDYSGMMRRFAVAPDGETQRAEFVGLLGDLEARFGDRAFRDLGILVSGRDPVAAGWDVVLPKLAHDDPSEAFADAWNLARPAEPDGLDLPVMIVDPLSGTAVEPVRPDDPGYAPYGHFGRNTARHQSLAEAMAACARRAGDAVAAAAGLPPLVERAVSIAVEKNTLYRAYIAFEKLVWLRHTAERRQDRRFLVPVADMRAYRLMATYFGDLGNVALLRASRSRQEPNQVGRPIMRPATAEDGPGWAAQSDNPHAGTYGPAPARIAAIAGALQQAVNRVMTSDVLRDVGGPGRSLVVQFNSTEAIYLREVEAFLANAEAAGERPFVFDPRSLHATGRTRGAPDLDARLAEARKAGRLLPLAGAPIAAGRAPTVDWYRMARAVIGAREPDAAALREDEGALIGELVAQCFSRMVDADLVAFTLAMQRAANALAGRPVRAVVSIPGRDVAQFAMITLARLAGIPTLDIEACAFGRLAFVPPHLSDRVTVIDSIQAEITAEYLGMPPDRIENVGCTNFFDSLAKMRATPPPPRAGYLLVLTQALLQTEDYLDALRMIDRWRRATETPLRIVLKPHPKERDRIAHYEGWTREFGADFEVWADATLEEAIAGASIVLVKSSNAGLQALHQRKPLVVLPGDDVTLDFTAHGVGTVIASEADFAALHAMVARGEEPGYVAAYHAANPWLAQGDTPARMLAAAGVAARRDE